MKNMARPNFDKAKREAKKLLEDFGIEYPPIDPELIAESSGVDVVYADFEGGSDISGFYDFDESRIYVNKDQPATRKNFTIAHELGHHILHQEYARSERYRYMPRNNAYAGAKPPEEREADAFAASLLVPLDMLKKYSKYSSAYEVSKLFAVSPEVIGFRRKWL